jgi:hypothetical protein
MELKSDPDNMPLTIRQGTESTSISGIVIPNNKLAREVAKRVRDIESPLLFNYSTRVDHFGSPTGKGRGLKFQSERLYVGAMFHEMGLAWTGIALHTTPGIPQYMHPPIALVTAGVEADVLEVGHSGFAETGCEAVVRAYPRGKYFREDIMGAI